MGYSYGGDETNYEMCFNPHKNFQLGWYVNGTKTITPIEMSGGCSFHGKLYGVSDYEAGRTVVLKINNKDSDGKCTLASCGSQTVNIGNI